MGTIPQMNTDLGNVDKRCQGDGGCGRYGIVMMQDRWWCRAHAGLLAFSLGRRN